MKRIGDVPSHRRRGGTASRLAAAAGLALCVAALSSACAALSAGTVEPQESEQPAGSGDPVESPEAVEAAARDSRFLRGAEAFDRGRFEEASRILRSLATRCGSGDRGREAVLLLAALEIDPRNPARFPRAGAQLAARYLQVPSPSPGSRLVAESLYLLALDLGADPVDDPFAPIPVRTVETVDGVTDGDPADGVAVETRWWSVADRFRECASEAPPEPIRDLPRLSGTPLRTVMDSLAHERAVLMSATDSLSAELERMRGLLRSEPPRPGGATGRP